MATLSFFVGSGVEVKDLLTICVAGGLIAVLGVGFVDKIHSERLRRWLVRFAWVLFFAGMIAFLAGEGADRWPPGAGRPPRYLTPRSFRCDF
jgi:uncharacterized membrane protein YfcA